ncbi:probable inactive shikimate kinase like 2, chloroplastic isoform X2 [Macadamia integrifolia]|uniref:probable inactive shikimate kinase like 2, chloroplastic isoform X2 n=1 Tax=Macadamia integrifolia TaxID=60698 RepID=UPI001C4E9793|nr:probable inactive shikimate kinase like 2, chloroplastic isoform X2 [Macadamia integrifolia]
MATSLFSTTCLHYRNSQNSLAFVLLNTSFCNLRPNLTFKKKFSSPKHRFLSNNVSLVGRFNPVSCRSTSTAPVNTRDYEFTDGATEVELRLNLGNRDIEISRDIFVAANESSLMVKMHNSGSLVTLIETNHLYGKIKPAETIWYVDEDELVVNLKKHDSDFKWPDIVESWESLSVGLQQLLKGTSIYIVGESTEINQKIARELAVGLGYTPLSTSDLLEAFSNQPIDSWVIAEGVDSVAQAEAAVFESLSSHVRAVVATLGGTHGAAGRTDKWRHLYAGFTVWLSQSESTDEDSAKEKDWKNINEGSQAYSNADVVVKLGGWDPAYSKTLAQASLSAIKMLILSDKKLPGKKNLYIRLGCRGDWPNIKPPGWDPSSGADISGGIVQE